jgi:hypothetical protein
LQVVALTLPEEVLDALRTVRRDPGWAIVRLVEPILHGHQSTRWHRNRSWNWLGCRAAVH